MKSKLTPLFPEAPEDLSGLSDEELSSLAADFQARARAIAANDPDVIGETPGESVIEQMTNGVTELERVRAEIASRAEAEQNYAASVGDLAAKFGLDDEAADVEPEAELAAVADEADEDEDKEKDEEPEAEASAEAETAAVEPEPITASAPVRLRRPPLAPAKHQPRAAESTGPQAAPLLASGGFESIARPGQKLGRAELVSMLGEAQRVNTNGKVVVASARFDYPEDRQLGDDMNANYQRVQAHTSMEAVLASGGFCAPYPPLYDLPVVASAIRPVRDALPGFGATRGGIQYPTPLGLSDVVGGISIITAAQDEDGGSLGTKRCVVIDCDPFLEAEVEAIAACVQHGNLNARAWPERVAAVTDLLSAAHAQAAEGELLAALTAGSTATTDAAVYGAFSTLLQGVLKSAAAYRSRHRMTPDTRLRAIFPAWVRELVVADLIHNEESRLDPAAAVAAVEGFFNKANLNITWYIDEDGTTTQVYDAQAAGALDDFLTTVVWYLFHEGAWIFLDMGRLDLGLVRDSTLNSTNDFNVFYETFEGAAMVGVESLRIESTVCPSGATAERDTLVTC